MPLFEGVDRIAVILYLLLVAAGMVCITSASYNDSIEEVFSFKHFYMKQVIWIGAAFGTALFILLLDSRYYHMYAYYAYAAGILLIAGTLVLPEKIAPVVNGAKAWYKFSESVRIQPVEFAKIATALAVARIMSNYSFSIKRIGDLFRVGLIIMLPMAIIVLQNDTGSGVVLCSFLFVLYREGLNKWICIPILMVAALFISSFLFTPLFLLSLLVLIFTISDAMMIGAWREHIVFLASVGVATLALYTLSLLLWDRALSAYVCMLIVMIAAVVVVALRGREEEHSVDIPHAGPLRRLDDLRAHHRHNIRIDTQTPPARTHTQLPRHRERPERRGLQRQPVEDRHRLGRIVRQGVHARHADKVQTSSPRNTPTSSSAPWARSGDSSARRWFWVCSARSYCA